MIFKQIYCSIDGILTGTTTSGQNGPKNNGNEGVLYIHQSFRTGVSPSEGLVSYPGHSSWEGDILPLCRDAVGIFYSPDWLEWLRKKKPRKIAEPFHISSNKKI